MYIGNNSRFKIQRANLDRSGLEDIVTDAYVFAMAQDPTPVPEPGAVVGIFAVAAAAVDRREIRPSPAGPGLRRVYAYPSGGRSGKPGSALPLFGRFGDLSSSRTHQRRSS